MDENTNITTAENNTQAAQEQPKEKLFTQAEVDEILRKRLAREKAKEAAPSPTTASDAELTARSNRLDCKEFILDNGLSPDLLDVIDTSNVEVFKEKVSKLQGIMPKVGSYPEVADNGEVLHVSDPDSDIRKAFANTQHIPKNFNY